MSDPYDEVTSINVRTTDGAARELEKFRRTGIYNSINSNEANRLTNENIRIARELQDLRIEHRKVVEQRSQAEVYLGIYEGIISSFVDTLRCNNIAESLEMAQMLMSKLRDPQNSGWVDGTMYADVMSAGPKDYSGPELHPMALREMVKDVSAPAVVLPPMTNEEIQKLVDEQEMRDKAKVNKKK